MTYAEWEESNNDFNILLLKAYHHWTIREECTTDTSKEVANSLIDKCMKEAYTIRSRYINAKVEV